MRSLRRIILTLLTLCGLVAWIVPCPAQSAGERTFRSVVVTLTDGSIIEGCPDGQFFIDYQTGMVILTDWEKVDLYIDAGKITGWHYRALTEEDIATSVHGVENDTSHFNLTADGLTITDAKADVTVYDIQGRVVRFADEAPEIIIPFAGMAPGTYIVKCGTASFKFHVR